MKLKYIYILVGLSLSLSLFSQKKITILHTNDVHSRIEPVPASDKKYPNTSGAINRKAVIDSVRKADKEVLLFDYGLDNMKLMFENLQAPVVNSNYDFSNTPLKDIVKPYIVINKYGLKIGVLGVGANPEGLIQADKYEGMIFKPIIESANQIAEFLKKDEKCDLIICLSHIGYRDTHANEEATAVLDRDLAMQSRYINIIIGGHSHTYMEKPVFIENKDGLAVMVTQMGKNGSFIGSIEVQFKEK